jgi:hypothetical protein
MSEISILFEHLFDELTQIETDARGCLNHVFVKDRDDQIYEVAFYDCVRLAQDLEYEVSSGRMCIADPGMIVLPAVRLANMKTAVEHLSNEGFFRRMIPISDHALIGRLQPSGPSANFLEEPEPTRLVVSTLRLPRT